MSRNTHYYQFLFPFLQLAHFLTITTITWYQRTFQEPELSWCQILIPLGAFGFPGPSQYLVPILQLAPLWFQVAWLLSLVGWVPRCLLVPGTLDISSGSWYQILVPWFLGAYTGPMGSQVPSRPSYSRQNIQLASQWSKESRRDRAWFGECALTAMDHELNIINIIFFSQISDYLVIQSKFFFGGMAVELTV